MAYPITFGRLEFAPSSPLLVVLLAVGTTLSELSFADEPTCQCHFKDPQWEGYGTRAACSAIMSNSDKTCNVSFGGTGADPSVVADILKTDPSAFSRQVSAAMFTYMNAVQKAPLEVNNPAVIRTVLPIFMRGAYLRKGITNSTNLTQLDKAVVQLLEKHVNEISDVFTGRTQPSPSPIDESGVKFFVNKGFITVEFADIKMTTVFSWAPLGR